MTWDNILPALIAGIISTSLGAIIGVIPGLKALKEGRQDREKSYLHIALRVDLNGNGFPSARTEIENKSVSKKKLGNALLLVGPEQEDPRDTMRELGIPVCSTNDIAAHKEADTVSGSQGRAFIPLPFFYSENVQISDEKVAYRAPINTHDIPVGEPYAVRFFIYTPERLHRSTHDSFVLPPSTP